MRAFYRAALSTACLLLLGLSPYEPPRSEDAAAQLPSIGDVSPMDKDPRVAKSEYVIRRTNTVLRAGPSHSAPAVATIAAGAPFAIDGFIQPEGLGYGDKNKFWYRGRTDDGQVGFLVGEALANKSSYKSIQDFINNIDAMQAAGDMNRQTSGPLHAFSGVYSLGLPCKAIPEHKGDEYEYLPHIHWAMGAFLVWSDGSKLYLSVSLVNVAKAMERGGFSVTPLGQRTIDGSTVKLFRLTSPYEKPVAIGFSNRQVFYFRDDAGRALKDRSQRCSDLNSFIPRATQFLQQWPDHAPVLLFPDLASVRID